MVVLICVALFSRRNVTISASACSTTATSLWLLQVSAIPHFFQVFFFAFCPTDLVSAPVRFIEKMGYLGQGNCFRKHPFRCSSWGAVTLQYEHSISQHHALDLWKGHWWCLYKLYTQLALISVLSLGMVPGTDTETTGAAKKLEL